MGDILPFVARVRASGDWTASERARLQDLADQFTAGGARVEVVFGTTEDGDPWCVVKDELEEVLVHVARIGGKFVVHYAVEDALEEGVDLHAALSDRLVAETAHDDVVVPFSIGGRHAQTFIALVIAAAFFYETQDVAVAAEGDVEPLQMQSAPDEAAIPAASDDLAPRQDRDLTANGSMFADPRPVATTQAASTPSETPAPTVATLAAPLSDAPPESIEVAEADEVRAPEAIALAAAPSAERNEMTGTEGDDVLVGTQGADHIRGGGGADTLQGGGAGVGEVDLLDGGDGDDRIELTAQVVATGGQGADTFVIQAPVVMGDASTLLGVVTDFSAEAGDRLVNARGESVMFMPPPGRPPPPGGEPPSNEMLPSLTPPATGPERQSVDLDGDGVVDGYVVLSHMWGPTVYDLPTEEQPRPHEDSFVLVRSVFDYTDFS